MGFVYVIWVLLKVEKIKVHVAKGIKWMPFWRRTFIRFVGIAMITSLYLLAIHPEKLFQVVLEQPMLWLLFVLVYSLFSVYPQELIYRTFFLTRYKSIISNSNIMVFVSAFCFSMAHLFFKSYLVLMMTFVGGILFALTFQKTKATSLVTLEHAIYGSWLFSVGYGEMLGFPA